MKRWAILITLVVVVFTTWQLSTLASRVRATTLLSDTPTCAYGGTVTSRVMLGNREYTTSAIVSHNGQFEMIEYPNGVTIITTPQETRTYRRKTREIEVKRAGFEPRFPANYEPRWVGDGVVAGQRAAIIDIRAKHGKNSSKRIWVDKKTGVILRTEVRDCCEKVRSSTEFTRISYIEVKALADSRFAKPEFVDNSWVTVTDSRANDIALAQKAVGVHIALPKSLPAGYKLAGVNVQPCPCCPDRKVAHIRYSDGMNSISIYEMSAKHNCAKSCKTSCKSKDCEIMRAGQANVTSVTRNDKNIIIVADIPAGELKKIAESID